MFSVRIQTSAGIIYIWRQGQYFYKLDDLPLFKYISPQNIV